MPSVSHVNPCVVLAIDTARRSGYAIRARGRLTYSGEVDTLQPHEVREIVSLACDGADKHTPVVLVLERPWGGRMHTLIALGQARERWLAPWAEFGQPRTRVVSVMPASWRARVLGRAYARATRDEVRAAELTAARTIETKTHWDRIGPDEAAAILISRWAAYAPQVSRVLPKRLQLVPTSAPPARRMRAAKGTRS